MMDKNSQEYAVLLQQYTSSLNEYNLAYESFTNQINELYEDCFCITSLENSNVITINIHNDHNIIYPSNTWSFSYSTDNGYTWTDITINPATSNTWTITEIDSSKNILFRGNNNTTLECVQIIPSKTYNVSGNILSLLDGDYSEIDELEDYCFYNFFYRSKVKDASRLILPDFTSKGCYGYMFYYSQVSKPPELPATTLAEGCYSYMFYACTYLEYCPALPATTLAVSCYAAMFRNCTALTEAPELPALACVQTCYAEMFYGCTNLKACPSIAAIHMATSCYDSMFRGCTSLLTPAALPAQLARGEGDVPGEPYAAYCYRRMFQGCTSFFLCSKIP